MIVYLFGDHLSRVSSGIGDAVGQNKFITGNFGDGSERDVCPLLGKVGRLTLYRLGFRFACATRQGIQVQLTDKIEALKLSVAIADPSDSRH
jgi:hypothetical protein